MTKSQCQNPKHGCQWGGISYVDILFMAFRPDSSTAQYNVKSNQPIFSAKEVLYAETLPCSIGPSNHAIICYSIIAGEWEAMHSCTTLASALVVACRLRRSFKGKLQDSQDK